LSDGAAARPRRGGAQLIPRPALVRPGSPPPWNRFGGEGPGPITVRDVRAAFDRLDPAEESGPIAAAADWSTAGAGPGTGSPDPALADGAGGDQGPPNLTRRPAAVLCALFDVDGEAEVLLTRRSSSLRSHTSQVSFPGGRLDPGESAVAAALREAREEVGLRPADVDVFGRLTAIRILANPAPVLPFVAGLPGPPVLRPNPAEVERVFTVPLVELTDPAVFREEVWTSPDGAEQAMPFFELVGDTVWGATARMLRELLDVVLLNRR
jgi:8-oxo-dGTP pyrophosphatase MutT (NUDIX family)